MMRHERSAPLSLAPRMTTARIPASTQNGIMAPLRLPVFRRIWIASLLSNFGFMILSVGAAWTMTLLTATAEMVALVQTALMLPMMLLSMIAGALADMYDRRKVGLAALAGSLLSAASLAALTLAGLTTPWSLLGFCFLIGAGMALFNPSWQASVGEQVRAADLPQAIALNSISFNIARSFGPALGGMIVATAGNMTAFTVTTLFYIPLFIVLLLWRRDKIPARLPPERIDRAVGAGVRYAIHSQPIRIVLIRTTAIGIGGGCVSALMPLIARDLIGGQAQTFGVMLGAFGVGSILGALALPRIRKHFSNERIVTLSSLSMALCVMVIAQSHDLALSVLALLGAGAGWMIALTVFNVVVQMSVPRWVTGRALAAYQSAIAGGIAVGSWFWGKVAEAENVSIALLVAAGLLALSVGLKVIWPIPDVDDSDKNTIELKDPDVNLAVSGRSGPVVVQIEYEVDMDDAREFYDRMLKVKAGRLRTGAFGWSLSRDMENPRLWLERYQCATWNDYLRQRSRGTPQELQEHGDAKIYHRGSPDLKVRRFLERPFGSVRWKEDAPDPHLGTLPPST